MLLKNVGRSIAKSQAANHECFELGQEQSWDSELCLLLFFLPVKVLQHVISRTEYLLLTPLLAAQSLQNSCHSNNLWEESSARSLNVSGYVCNHGSPSGERDTASPRGHYGERLQRDSCLKKHMKKHHPLAGDSP